MFDKVPSEQFVKHVQVTLVESGNKATDQFLVLFSLILAISRSRPTNRVRWIGAPLPMTNAPFSTHVRRVNAPLAAFPGTRGELKQLALL